MDQLLGEHGLAQDTAAAREEFERQMEVRRLEAADPEPLRVFRRGLCWGGEVFKRRMLEQMEGKPGEHHCGELRGETAQAKSERIVGEELRRLGWRESDLASRLLSSWRWKSSL
ncbi:MAG: hypothetical protein ACLQU3_08680 [Limisphaerales bacterium]